MQHAIIRFPLVITLFITITIMVWVSPSEGFEFQGFGAVTAKTTDNNTDPDRAPGFFEIGQLDFFVSQSIGDRLDLLTELVVEGSDEGEFVVDLERFQIGYVVSNLLTIRAGRFHTPLGYWNATYHHGFHLQTSIERPGFIEFEDDGGLLPVHLIGLWARGYQALGPIIAEYDVMVGNGSKVQGLPGAAVLTPNSVTENDARKAFAYRLELRPAMLPQGGIGLSGYIDKIEIFDLTPALTDEVKQMILGVDLFYVHTPVELIGEYYYVRNSQQLSSSSLQGENSNSLFYIQGGYTLFEKLTPYARYEQQAVLETEDPYFSALGATDLRKVVGGLRYDITPQSAIKLEGRHIDPKNQDDYQEYAAQWTIAF